MSANDTRRSIRGPEDVDAEIRDAMCGSVARAVLAATGLNCAQRSVDEVADQLDDVRDVRVSRWDEAADTADSRDFLDVVVRDDTRSGRVFLITERNGFSPEVMRARDDETVLQFKR